MNPGATLSGFGDKIPGFSRQVLKKAAARIQLQMQVLDF
jgi:hypothetical protein